MNPKLSPYRDPGNVAFSPGENKWFRLASPESANALRELRNSSTYGEFVGQGWILPYEEVPASESEKLLRSVGTLSPRKVTPELAVFRVESLGTITFPWEWTDSMLRDAADLTLKVRDGLLSIGLDLKDASAFNIQFRGSIPVLMDLGSVHHWKPQVSWPAYRQFVEHFVNPLAVGSSTRFSAGQAWRLGGRDGIGSRLARTIMPARLRFSIRLALLQFAAVPGLGKGSEAASPRPASDSDAQLCLSANRNLNRSLRRQVVRFGSTVQKSTWQTYGPRSHYRTDEIKRKILLAGDFVSRNGGDSDSVILDLGGNDGAVAFSLAEAAGVKVVIADSDPGALDNLSGSLASSALKDRILPVLVDLTNLDLSRGVLGSEFELFEERIRPTVVFCHAVLHHVVISQGTPIETAVAILAKFGVPVQIEFVHEDDAMVELLKSQISDWRGSYSLEELLIALGGFFENVVVVERTTPTRSIVEAHVPRRENHQ